MRLLDRVSHAARAMVVTLPGSTQFWHLPGPDELAADIATCPLRYVLGDGVTELCTQLAFEDNSILGSSQELVRVPAPLLWIEFAGSVRYQVFSDLGFAVNEATGRQRIGLLVSSDASGRKGRIDVCWENRDDLSLDLSPLSVEYDFDDPSYSETGTDGGDASLINVKITDAPALEELWGCIRFRLHPQWLAYCSQATENLSRYREILLQVVRLLLEDVPFFAVFCLLLSSKSALRQAPVDRNRLNAARQRRGKPPLLDHVELTMNLAGASARNGGAGPRSSPRLHFVRGHLVRRGNAIYWRSSHMRGTVEKCAVVSRTVSIHIGR